MDARRIQPDAGLSKCYMFKSRLNEYAEKAGFPTPMYETLKEGPAHQPVFQSTVTVDNVRYDSLPGFYNRKVAEQSAAEVALSELVKSGKLKEPIVYPIYETGLCKNLLQGYAHKKSYVTPTYACHVDESPGIKLKFSCSVNVGGTHYVGPAASTKKEAEIKAARTALLTILSFNNGAEAKPNGSPLLTVLPGRKEPELDTKKEEAKDSLKGKKRKRQQAEVDQAAADVECSKDNNVAIVTEVAQIGAAGVPVANAGEENHGVENSLVVLNQNEEEQKLAEAGDVQRRPEQVRVSDSLDQPIDS